MCQECTDMLLESLEKQLEDVGRERDCYIDFLKKVKDSQVTDEEEQELRQQVEEVCLYFRGCGGCKEEGLVLMEEM